MARRVGRVLLLAALAALLALPVFLIAHPIAYVPFISAVLMVVASWAYLQVMRRSVHVSVDSMAASCSRGEKTPLRVTLSNRAVVPCARVQMDFFVTDLFGGFDDIRTISCSIRAREVSSVDFDVQFAHVGTYHAGVSRVVVHDLLGLFSASLGDGARRQVVVRPRRASMGSSSVATAVPDESQKALKPVTADDVDYASVREYRFGDPLKTVHWNLSARDPGGTMYTRLFEAYVNPSLSVVLDPFAAKGSSEELMTLFDGMVEVAASLSEQARAAGIDAEVRYINRDGLPSSMRIATMDDANDLVVDMMRIEPTGDGAAGAAAEEMLRDAGLRSHGSGNVALVTGRTDASEIEALIEIAMARRNAMAFLAVPRSLSEREREKYVEPMSRLSASGGSWWAVESNEVMTEVVGL